MHAQVPIPPTTDIAELSTLRHRVAALDQAPVALLAERVLEQRFDRKFLAPLADVVALVDKLGPTHVVVMAEQQRLAHYETTYFDTRDRRAFHDHRRGRPRRAKVRSRTYVDRGLTILEVKQRSGRGTTIKARRERAVPGADLTAEEQRWTSEHTGWRGALHKAGSNRFSRITLLGVEHVERVTIDVGLTFGRDGREVSLARTCLIELKTPTRGQVSPAATALSELGLRKMSFSKYCVGSILLDDSLPHNRFGTELRAVARIEEA